MKLLSLLLIASLALGLGACKRSTYSVSYGGYYSRDCYWGGYYSYGCSSYWGCYPNSYCYYWNTNESRPNDTTTLAKKSWSEALGISERNVKRIDQAISMGLKNDPRGYKAIGLSDGDLKRLARGRAPSEKGLKNVARKFSITPRQSRELFLFLLDGVKKQSKDFDSPLWRGCVSAGKWHTPESKNCKSSSWSGCSPDTGASMCIPDRT